MNRIFFVAENTDKEMLVKSSSGAIFSAIAEDVLERGGCVFGACYDPKLKIVKHLMADSVDGLEGMRKSKYVWSDLSECIDKIRDCVNNNIEVLFSGTPCQNKLLKSKFENASNITYLDFFCHGTVPPVFFRDYIREFQPECYRIDFRGQQDNSEDNFCIKMWDSDGNEILKQEYWRNIYTRLYVNSAILRKACMNCCFEKNDHLSDITVGDFDHRNLARERGVKWIHPSVCLINSTKGLDIWERIKKRLICFKLTDDEEKLMDSYFRDHSLIKGDWGYNEDIRSSFASEYVKSGFKKAAINCLYSEEIKRISRLLNASGDNEIYIFGAGVNGKRIHDLIKEQYPSIKLVGFVVTDPSNEVDCDERIIGIDELLNENKKCFIIIAVDEPARSEIVAMLEKKDFYSFV